MVSRRCFASLFACLMVLMSMPSAFGWGSGKDSTIRVVNKVVNPIYVFVDVSDADLNTAAAKPDPIAAFKSLGGKQIAAGGNSATFDVKAGPHTVTARDIVKKTAVGKKNVTTTKGSTVTVEFP